MSAIPANLAYGYGFGMGTRYHTHTHTQTYPWAKPMQVLKPVPITIFGGGSIFSYCGWEMN